MLRTPRGDRVAAQSSSCGDGPGEKKWVCHYRSLWHSGMWPCPSAGMSGCAWTLHREPCTGRWCWRTSTSWSLWVRTLPCDAESAGGSILVLSPRRTLRAWPGSAHNPNRWALRVAVAVPLSLNELVMDMLSVLFLGTMNSFPLHLTGGSRLEECTARALIFTTFWPSPGGPVLSPSQNKTLSLNWGCICVPG